MLEALVPGRIDLGIGRAPGGDRRTAAAMSDGPSGRGYGGADRFPEQVMDLVGYLDNSLPAEHPFAGVRAQPAAASGEGAPQVWLLGSSDYSALLAAELGLRFGFAHFISAQGGAAVTRAYRERFRPSAREPQAAALACVFVICADSNAEAERLAATIDLRRLHMAYGNDNVVPSTEEALSHRYSAEERAYVEQQRARLIHGDAARVKDRLQQLSEEFGADELLAITITGDYASRLRSYQLLAEELL
jgi:luciferase family oxidoreductase group 1